MSKRSKDWNEGLAQDLKNPKFAREFLLAAIEEGITLQEDLLSEIQWIEPNRALTAEITRVLTAGYVRGADCWHLASALFLAPNPTGFTFLTRDVRQREVAQTLGFET